MSKTAKRPDLVLTGHDQELLAAGLAGAMKILTDRRAMRDPGQIRKAYDDMMVALHMLELSEKVSHERAKKAVKVPDEPGAGG